MHRVLEAIIVRLNLLKRFKALRRTLTILHGLQQLLASEFLFFQVRRQMYEMRKYTLEECAGLVHDAGCQPMRLGVVGGYPLLKYVRLGYDWLACYYNPMLIFDEVHYFQSEPCRERVLDWGFPVYIHGSTKVPDIVAVCQKYHIDILRSYDSFNGRIAVEAARQLKIPVIVSIH